MTPLALLNVSVLTALVAAAAYMDLKERRIPNAVTVPGLFAGLTIGALMQGGFPSAALAGSAVALLISLPLYALGGIGAGDAKLFTAVGAFVGTGGLLSVFIYGGLAGGVLAIANATRRGAILGLVLNTWNLLLHWITLGRAGHRISLDSPNAHSVPYGVAIAAGAILALLFPLSVAGTP